MPKKITKKYIKSMDSDKFGSARILVDGEYKELRKGDLKNHIAKEFGGKSLREIEEKFKKAGLKGSQVEKRKGLIKAIKGEGLSPERFKAHVKANIAQRLREGGREHETSLRKLHKSSASDDFSTLSSQQGGSKPFVKDVSSKPRFAGQVGKKPEAGSKSNLSGFAGQSRGASASVGPGGPGPLRDPLRR